MTLPDERYRAVTQTREFLKEILSTPRVPKKIKDSARWCLRHYPTEFDMRETADKIPEIFATEMEPLYRMVKQHEQDKADDNNKSITG